MTTNAFRGTASFTVSSSDISTYSRIVASNGGIGLRREKLSVLALFATIAASAAPAGTATVEIALTDGAKVYERRSITVTATSKRSGTDGASGDYIGTVSDAISGRNVSDLVGMDQTGPGSERDQLYWVIGMTANTLTNFTRLDLWYQCEPAM